MQVVIEQHAILLEEKDNDNDNQTIMLLSLKLAIKQHNMSFIHSYLDQQLPLHHILVGFCVPKQHPLEWILIYRNTTANDTILLFELFLSTTKIQNQLVASTLDGEFDNSIISFIHIFDIIFKFTMEDHTLALLLLKSIRNMFPNIPGIIMAEVIKNFLDQHKDDYSMEYDGEVVDAVEEIGWMHNKQQIVRDQFSFLLHFQNVSNVSITSCFQRNDLFQTIGALMNYFQDNHYHPIDMVLSRMNIDELNEVLFYVGRHISTVNIAYILSYWKYYKYHNILNQVLEYGAKLDFLYARIPLKNKKLVVFFLDNINRQQINLPVFDFVNRMIRKRPELAHVLSIVASYLTVPTNRTSKHCDYVRIPRRIQEVTCMDMPGAKKFYGSHNYALRRCLK